MQNTHCTGLSQINEIVICEKLKSLILRKSLEKIEKATPHSLSDTLTKIKDIQKLYFKTAELLQIATDRSKDLTQRCSNVRPGSSLHSIAFNARTTTFRASDHVSRLQFLYKQAIFKYIEKEGGSFEKIADSLPHQSLADKEKHMEPLKREVEEFRTASKK